MIVQQVIKGLEKNAMVFQALFDVSDTDLILFKPSKDKWCFLEIVCHLIDEEVEDFRTRVGHCLDNIEQPLTSISPQTWPIERDYLHQDYQQKVQQFIAERQKSIEFLNCLPDSDWNVTFDHPVLGIISANRFLHNWLAHDYLHIRQLNALKFEFLQQNSGEDLTYAGNW